MFPAASTATPEGPLNRDATSGPSVEPYTPAAPAMVVTAPAVEIRRIVLFAPSATMRFPAPSNASPDGPLNCAPAPVPSWLPLTPGVPAKVVTVPSDAIFRMVLLPESETKIFPDPSTAVHEGLLNFAAAPTASR